MQKTAIVTGANAGLGFQVARGFLSQGVKLLLGSRSLERGENAKARLLEEFPSAQITVGELDLADLESISPFVQRAPSGWDFLVNNAGAKIEKPFKQTTQGHEWHLGVNHLGHFALTRELWPKATAEATVVTVSSIVARRGVLNLNPEQNITAAQAYANSKLMNYAFSRMLANKIQGTDRKSAAAHPGFARANPYGNQLVRIAEYVFAQTVQAGAKPIKLACHSENGTYLAPSIYELWGKPAPAIRPEISEELLQEFWSMSEKQSGGKFSPASD